MPFKSEAQRRLFHAKAERGEIPHSTVHEWEHATKNKKSLPYHVKKSSASLASEVLHKLAQGTPVPISLTTQAPKASPVPHAATAEAPPQAGDQLIPNATQKAAATLSPSGGGPAPSTLAGPKPNQLQDNLTSGSTLGLSTPPPPAGPGIANTTQASGRIAQPKPIANAPNSTQAGQMKGAELADCMIAQMKKLASARTSTDQIPGGRAEGKSPSDFPRSERAHAREVEKEHSSDPKIQEEIGRDHDVENPRYYANWLLPMEKIMQKHPKSSLWDYVKVKK